MDMAQIQKPVNEGSWEFSLHALKQMAARGIRAAVVLEVLQIGE